MKHTKHTKHTKHIQTQKSNNYKIILLFTIIKNYYYQHDDMIHANAYERAIYQITRYPNKIKNGNDLQGIQGIGKGIIDKIDIILKTGTLPPIINEKINDWLKNGTYEKYIEIMGFSNRYVRELNAKYNTKTVADIQRLVLDGKIHINKTQEMGLNYYNDLRKQISRNEIAKIYKQIENSITKLNNEINNKINVSNYKNANKCNIKCFLAGSYPSNIQSSSKDIDVLCVYDNTNNTNNTTNNTNNTYNNCTTNNIQIINKLKEIMPLEIISLGQTKFAGIIKSQYSGIWRRIDMRFVSIIEFPYAWLYYTGGKVFNILFRETLKKKGYKLNEYGLYTQNKLVNLDDNSNDNSNENSNEDLIEHAEIIIAKIFNIAGMEYKDVSKRY